MLFPWQKAGAQKGKPNLTSAFQAYTRITSMNLLSAQGNHLAEPKVKGWRSTPPTHTPTKRPWQRCAGMTLLQGSDKSDP